MKWFPLIAILWLATACASNNVSARSVTPTVPPITRPIVVTPAPPVPDTAVAIPPGDNGNPGPTAVTPPSNGNVSGPTDIAPVVVASPVVGNPGGSGIVINSPSTVNIDADGQTIHLRVGESFTLFLGTEMDWSNVEVADQQIISRRVNVMVIRGSQGIYEAHSAGKTELTATGTPICDPNVACPQLARLFHIQIVVE